MNGQQSRPGNSDQILLDLLGKGLNGYFKAPEDGIFSDLLAKLDAASDRDARTVPSRQR